MFPILIRPEGPGAILGMLLLTTLALGIVLALIVLIEMVVLQLLRWGNFRQALRAAAVMNVVSSVVCGFLLLAFPRPNVWGLLAAGVLSAVIEALMLMRMRHGARRENLLAALAANTASYLLLIVPAYLFRD